MVVAVAQWSWCLLSLVRKLYDGYLVACWSETSLGQEWVVVLLISLSLSLDPGQARWRMIPRLNWLCWFFDWCFGWASFTFRLCLLVGGNVCLDEIRRRGKVRWIGFDHNKEKENETGVC